MRFRRSRCVCVTVVIVLLQLVVLSMLHYGASSSVLLSEKLKEYNVDLSGLNFLFKPKDAYSFNAWVDKITWKFMRQSESDSLKMERFSISQLLKKKGNKRDSISLPKYLKGKGEHPHLAPFDPKLTLGLFLNHINSKLEESGGSTQNIEIEHFHWGDWTDLSLLNLLSLTPEKPNCASLDSRPANRGKGQLEDPLTFCYNDDQIEQLAKDPNTDPSLKDLFDHILSLTIKTGFHVFAHPGRGTLKNMQLVGASYLNDFMPAPLSVLFLLPTESHSLSLQFPVKQEVSAKVRAIDSPMASSVAQRQNSVLVSNELLKTLKLTLEKEKPVISAATKELSPDSFRDHLEQIFQELGKNYEMTPHERNYFNSLFSSLKVEIAPKYFNEARLTKNVRNYNAGGHYDWRFFKGLINSSDLQLPVLHGLLLAWLRFANSNDLTTWLAHGSLLSWYWNGMVFPWDADIDVQMPIADLHKLSRNFNQTIVVDFGPDVNQGARYGRYFIDCATWISHRRMEAGQNFIDARFVDLNSGLYIDITGLAVSNTMASERFDSLVPELLVREDPFAEQNELNRAAGKPTVRSPDGREQERNELLNLFNCRNNHFLSLEEISPLKLTYMEGVPAFIPHGFTSIVQHEYGLDSTAANMYRAFAFLPRLRLWEKTGKVKDHLKKASQEPIQIDMGSDTTAASEVLDKLAMFSLSDKEYIELMASVPQVMVDYLVSRDATALHEEEMSLLLQGQSTQELLFDNGKLRHKFLSFRPDFTDYVHHKHNYDFAEQVKMLDEQIAQFKAGQTVDVGNNVPEEDSPRVEPVNAGGIRPLPVRVQTPEAAKDNEVNRQNQAN